MTRTIDIRFDILRNGVRYGKLDSIGEATVRMDYNSAIKSSLSGDFKKNNTFDYLKDEIQPVLIIDGVEHPYGVYAPSTVSVVKENGLTYWHIEAYDRNWRVKTTIADTYYYIASQTNVVQKIESMLNVCGIVATLSVPSALTLTLPREYEIGTDYLTIINELLENINYKELMFDSNGFAIIEPKATISSADVVRNYRHDSAQSLMLDSFKQETDLFETPNKIILICQTYTGYYQAFTALNENPMSPFSIQSRGRTIAKVFKAEKYSNVSTLQDRANLLMEEYIFQNAACEISTALLPYLAVGSAVTLSHPEENGLFRESAWTVNLACGGRMTHTLDKVALLL